MAKTLSPRTRSEEDRRELILRAVACAERSFVYPPHQAALDA
ncbi:MAG: hypothetical protein ACRDOE_22175 [Streptosporangiaceae bacterium]